MDCSHCGGQISVADAMLRIGWCKACRATNPMWRGDQKDAIYGYRQQRAGTAESWWITDLSYDAFSTEVRRRFVAR